MEGCHLGYRIQSDRQNARRLAISWQRVRSRVGGEWEFKCLSSISFDPTCPIGGWITSLCVTEGLIEGNEGRDSHQ